LTSRIEGFENDERIFTKELVDNEQTEMRNTLAIQMSKIPKQKKATVQKIVQKQMVERFN
jgi:hypothetical protein